jgi:hypothetical protein
MEDNMSKHFDTIMEELKWKLNKTASEFLGAAHWVYVDYKIRMYDTGVFTVTVSSVPAHPDKDVPYTPMEFEYLVRADSDDRLNPDWLHSIVTLDGGTYMLCGWISGQSSPIALKKYSVRFIEGNKVEWFETPTWMGLTVDQLLLVESKGLLQPAGSLASEAGKEQA